MRLLDTEKNLYAVEAFLPDDIPADSIKAVQQRLEHHKYVDSVSFISADSALRDFRSHFSAEMLDLVEGNPLPPYFRMTVKEENQNPGDLAVLVNALSSEDYFEEVQAPVDWVEKIAAWKFKMIFWPICISILLLITLSLIICNSVRLSLLSRKLLVENMKYAGGSYFFIEFPFVMQGVIQGFLGSGFAVVLLFASIRSLTQSLPIVDVYAQGAGFVFVAVILLVTILSGYFSFSTVRRFLNVKRSEQD
ncbi:ABC transporter permease [Fibrobacter sp. UWR4]|uniref:cell division protein FtsX n=2 Tax=unclassified Fibrobacter TaxID=2634177 RepID=UPI001E57307D|nr:permease-like cell division protein FtsX [Fibrobacter sp. UWR4]